MDKLKRFIDIFVPTETCNLRCGYCYITQNRKFNGKLFEFDYSIDDLKKAFSKERLGGVCLINFCAGGETLLSPSMTDIIRALLECGHYLMIVTNGTLSKRFEEMSNFSSDLKDRLFIKFSFHYLELKNKNLLDVFIKNVELMKDSGISFTVELAASDDYIPYQEEIIELCENKFGAKPHITILRDDRKAGLDLLSEFDMDELTNKWKKFDSKLFDFRKKIWQVRRKEFCYAGDWSFCVDLKTGEITKCFGEKCLGNIFDYDKPLKFECVGKNCKYPYCYAGHAFLALGVIPEVDLGSFDELRDRSVAKWLSPSMKNIMRQKLKDNNKEYYSFRKILISKSVRGKNGKEFKNYTYKLIKKLKNDKAPFVDIVEARQEIKNYNNKIPKKYYWIFNTVFNKISLNEGMNIKIRALNMKNHKAQGEEIWLVGALVDNNWYNANELIRGKWLSRNNSIGWRNYDLLKPISNSVDMLVPYSNKLVLVFEKNKWRGVCEIEFNGKIIKKDCYSKKDDELMFVKIK